MIMKNRFLYQFSIIQSAFTSKLCQHNHLEVVLFRLLIPKRVLETLSECLRNFALEAVYLAEVHFVAHVLGQGCFHGTLILQQIRSYFIHLPRTPILISFTMAKAISIETLVHRAVFIVWISLIIIYLINFKAIFDITSTWTLIFENWLGCFLLDEALGM